MKRLALIGIALALTLAGCGSSAESGGGASGKIAPPAWILGKWEGGSPILLHLNFTEDSILNAKGKPALPNYVEVEKSDTTYTVEYGNELSYFEMINSSRLNWLNTNGVISDVTVMKRKY